MEICVYYQIAIRIVIIILMMQLRLLQKFNSLLLKSCCIESQKSYDEISCYDVTITICYENFNVYMKKNETFSHIQYRLKLRGHCTLQCITMLT